MDSNRNKICKIFALLMLYLRSATATNIDCNGKPFHCVNSTHFMICVDLGAGVSKTVDDLTIQCPPPTMCLENNNYECEYQLSSTTQPNIPPGGDKSNFTIDIQKITTSSNDMTNSISGDDKTSVVSLFNESFNTPDVTTYANYVSETQTYNVWPSTSNNHSKSLMSSTETYTVENIAPMIPEMNNTNRNDSLKIIIPSNGIDLLHYNPILSYQSGQVISEQSTALNITNKSKNITNISNGTVSNGEFHFTTLMDILHDTPVETETKDASTLMVQKTNDFRETTILATQTENSDTFTKSFPQKFETQTTLIQGINYFENTSSIIKTFDQVGQKMTKENSPTSSQVNSLLTPEEKISEISVLNNAANTNFHEALSTDENKIEFITELNLIAHLTPEKAINTLSPYEVNVSDVTEYYNYINIFSTLESKMTPTDYVTEAQLTTLTTLRANEYFYNNKKIMFPKETFTSTIITPITLEDQLPYNIRSNSAINEINMTSTLHKPTSENLAGVQGVNLTGENIREMVTESVSTSFHANDNNTLLLDDDLLEATSEIIKSNYDFHHTTLSIENQSTTPELNLFEQKIKEKKLYSTPSYGKNISEGTIRGDISTKHANIPNLSFNDSLKTLLSLNTSDSVLKTIENETTNTEITKSTMVTSNDINRNIMLHYENARQRIPEEETSSTALNTLSLSFHVSTTENITAMELNTTANYDAFGNNYLPDEIITTTTQLNLIGQSIDVKVTDNSRNTAEYHKLLPEEESGMNTNSSIIESPYSYDTLLTDENRKLKPKPNVKELLIRDKNNANNNISEVPFPRNIHIPNTTTHDFSVNTELPMLYDYFTTISSLSVFDKAATTEQVTDIKEVLDSNVGSYDHNTNNNETFILKYEIATNMPSTVTVNLLNSGQLEYHASKEKILATKTMISTFDENSTPNPGIQVITEKIIYDEMIEKIKPLQNSSFIKDNKYIEQKMITSSGNYSSTEAGNDVSNINITENTSTEPGLRTMATFNSVLGLKIIPHEVLQNEVTSLSNDLNTKITPVLQYGKNTRIKWRDVIVTSTENPITLENNILELNKEITIDMKNNATNANDDNILLGMLNYKTVNGMVLPIGVNKFTRGNNSYDTRDKITTSPKIEDIPINTYATEVTLQNLVFNDIMRFSADDKIMITDTEQKFTITNGTNTTNKTLTEKLDKPYFSSNKSSIYLENTLRNQGDKIENPLVKILYSAKKRYDAKDEINYTDQITIFSKIDSIPTNTYAPEVTIQNQVLNDTMIPTSQDQNIQTTEEFLLDGYDVTNSDVLVTNDMVVPTAPKPLMKNLRSKLDEILTTHNQITTEVFTDNYLISSSTENPKDIVTNIANNWLNKNQINKHQEISRHIDNTVVIVNMLNSTQNLDDKIISTETEQNFTIINATNTKRKNFFVKPDKYYFLPDKSSTYLENITYNEDIKMENALEKTLNSTEIPLDTLETLGYTYGVTKIAPFINDTHFLTNDSIRSDYSRNDSNTVTTSLMSERNVTSDHILHFINNTSKNVNIINKQLNTVNEDKPSNKRSVLVTPETPANIRSFIIQESNTVHKNLLKINKTPLDAKVSSEFTINNTGGIKSIISNNTGDIYPENMRRNNTLHDNNLLREATNKTHYNNITRIPMGYLGSVTTEHYQPVIPVLSVIRQKGPGLRSTHGNKSEATDLIKRDENLQVISTDTPIVNKITFASINLAESESRNIKNVSTKVNQSFTSTNIFRCYNRSRGRFADKNNCRKYYVCIGKHKPILGACPYNTVFSEIKKQCTKNLSHCIRNNQFRCIKEGRFSDVLRSNIYYICINNNNAYVRFQFQCQNGYQLNKTSVRCVNNIKFHSQVSAMPIDNDSNKESDQSIIEHKSKEKKKPEEDATYICKQEGKFPLVEDCRRYYVCSKNSRDVFRRRTKKCDSDEVFHREKKKCVDRDSYECNC